MSTDCCKYDIQNKDEVQNKCRTDILEAVIDQIEGDQDPILIDALPTLGKSHNVAGLSKEIDEKILILTRRHENRDEAERKIEEEVGQFPRLREDCSTYRGEHGHPHERELKDFLKRGIPPGYIHANFSEDLPCGIDCDYMQKWERLWNRLDSYDVIIGHPLHANIPEVVEDRVVVFDEIPDGFRTDFDSSDPSSPDLHKAISDFLQRHDKIDAETKEDLTELRGKYVPDEKRRQVIEAIKKIGFSDYEAVAEEYQGYKKSHINAPAAALALVSENREHLGNNMEYIDLPRGEAVYDRSGGSLHLRNPPDLSESKAVVGLDGFPTTEVWEGRLGIGMERKRVLCSECRRKYLKEILGYRIFTITTNTKPYTSGKYVQNSKDYAVIKAIENTYGKKPAVITTKNAERELFEENGEKWCFSDPDKVYDTEDCLGKNDVMHYGEIKSSNKFADKDLGLVLGSPHPGDKEIKVLSAFDQKSAEREKSETPTKGSRLTYGIDGDPYLRHFRENQVAQAVLRFGRRDGGVVLVYTSAVPDWLSEDWIPGGDVEGDVVTRIRSPGEKEVIQAMQELEKAETRKVLERVGLKNGNTVRDHLRKNSTYIEEAGSSGKKVWIDTDLDDINVYGEVLLPNVHFSFTP